MNSEPPAAGRRSWGRADAAGGLVLATIFMQLLGVANSHFWFTDDHLSLILSYLVVWVPLLGAVLVASLVRGSGSLTRDFALRFRAFDLLWGLSIGLLARAVGALLEIVVYGKTGSAEATLGSVDYDLWWVFGAIAAPVVIAPLIEELFFRGLVLRAVSRSTHGVSPNAARVTAIVVSGSSFALLHLLNVDSASSATVIGLSTLVFGLAAATLATTTGRLGGAIIAHITFNALVIVPALF